jgi:hypothetical protein
MLQCLEVLPMFEVGIGRLIDEERGVWWVTLYPFKSGNCAESLTSGAAPYRRAHGRRSSDKPSGLDLRLVVQHDVQE